MDTPPATDTPDVLVMLWRREYLQHHATCRTCTTGGRCDDIEDLAALIIDACGELPTERTCDG